MRNRLTHPQLLEALGRAGHGSTVLIADANYAHSTGGHPAAERVHLNLRPGLLTADQVRADEALRLGLVNHVVPQAELLPFCRQLLVKILGKAPLAVGLVLECVHAHYAKGADGYAAEVKAFGQAFESDDFKEGTTAFVEKRAAVFTGK